MKKEKSCGCIVIDGDQVLLIKNNYGRWTLPKGHMEKGETEQETAIREVKEETNLDVNEEDLELIGIVSGNSRRNEYPNGDVVINNTALYCIINFNGELKWDEESKNMKFFDLDNMPSNQNDPDLIEYYCNFLRKSKTR